MQKKSSNFSDKVKAAVKKIPPGNTMSYKDVAIIAGNPASARAVAAILSKNFDQNIPCHRVIKSNGKLGGYNRGGSAQKRKLLDQEKKFQKPEKTSLK